MHRLIKLEALQRLVTELETKSRPLSAGAREMIEESIGRFRCEIDDLEASLAAKGIVDALLPAPAILTGGAG